MWRPACNRIETSVHPVLLRTEPLPGAPRWETIGTAFCINHKHNPTFITNAHVVDSRGGNSLPSNSLALIVMAPGGAVAALSVMVFDKEFDIAVCEASKEAATATPVTFSGAALLTTGTSVASTGFPIPDQPEVTPAGGKLNVSKRLATGYLSNPQVQAKMPNWPWTDSLPHYELNMLAYPGISGGPLITLDGTVAGVNRGSRLHSGQVAAYAIAVRNAELLPLLDRYNIAYSVV